MDTDSITHCGLPRSPRPQVQAGRQRSRSVWELIIAPVARGLTLRLLSHFFTGPNDINLFSNNSERVHLSD